MLDGQASSLDTSLDSSYLMKGRTQLMSQKPSQSTLIMSADRPMQSTRNRPMSSQANPLLRTTDGPIKAITRRGNGRPSSVASGGLNQSTYVRSPAALSVLQN